jgi:hypothetical protein
LNEFFQNSKAPLQDDPVHQPGSGRLVEDITRFNDALSLILLIDQAEAKNLIFEQQILAIEQEKEVIEQEKKREREAAIRKLRELGVSEEIIAVSFSGAV